MFKGNHDAAMLCLLFGIALGASHLAAQSPYQLRIAAQPGDTISGEVLTSVGDPALNNNGLIAFLAGATGSNTGGIFTTTRQVARALDIISGIEFLILSNPVLNDSGEVAFVATSLQSSGIFTVGPVASVPSLVVQEGQTISGLTLTTIINGFRSLALNNLGGLVFFSFFNGTSGRSTPALFTPSIVISAKGSVISGQTITGFSNQTALSNNAVVVFGPAWNGGGGVATPTTILEQPGETIGGLIVNPLNINFALGALGNLAFIGTYSGGWGVFTPNRVLAQTGDTIGGKVVNGQPSYLSVNSTGTVAFIAPFDGGNGVFTQRSLVAQTGDIISGKTIMDFSGTVINNSGDIAFRAYFSDGTQAIVEATLPSSLSVSPRGQTFAAQKAGTVSAPKVVVVTNKGSQPITLTGFQTMGQFVQVNNCQSTLFPGHSCGIAIFFAPSTQGAKAGQVIFLTPGNPNPYVITLAGAGTP